MRKLLVRYLGLYGLLVLATLPLVLGWVPPNRWYGFRFPGARLEPALWYQINAMGGRLFIAGLIMCALVNAVLIWRALKLVRPHLGWLNVTLILLNFWIVTTDIITRLPG